MKTIWKYQLDPNNLEIFMPQGAKILFAGVQNSQICIWAEVDSSAGKEKRIFQVFGTGHTLTDHDMKYIGTVTMYSDSLVFHIYEQV